MKAACHGTSPNDIIHLQVQFNTHNKDEEKDKCSDDRLGHVRVQFAYKAETVAAMKKLAPSQR